MARTTWMHRKPRVGQLLHEQAGTAGVVQVDVGKNDPFNPSWLQARVLECREHARHRIIRTGIDHRGTPVFNNDVDCIKGRTQIA